MYKEKKKKAYLYRHRVRREYFILFSMKIRFSSFKRMDYVWGIRGMPGLYQIYDSFNWTMSNRKFRRRSDVFSVKYETRRIATL